MNAKFMIRICLFLVVAFFFVTSAHANTEDNQASSAVPEIKHALNEQEAGLVLTSPAKWWSFQGLLSPYQAMPDIPHTIKELEKASMRLTGRDQLASHGVQFFVTYTSAIAGNPVGGLHPGGGTYADIFAFGCLLQTEELFGWHGGYFTMSGIQYNGNSLSQKNIGNEFAVQQTFVGQGLSFYELFYDQKFWNDHASLTVGRIVSGDEFATSPLYWLYMNAGIDGTPIALAFNEDISFYASATWGSVLKVELPGSMVARLGAYQVTEDSDHGLTWNFYPRDGVITLAQYAWNPEFFKPSASSRASNSDYRKATETASLKKPVAANHASTPPASSTTAKGFQGHYWMGGYYSSSEHPQFTGGTDIPNAYGLYWHADQSVYQPSLMNNSGLVLWSTCVLCPQQNISVMPFQVNAGAVYTGLIPGRRNDFTIFGVAYGNFSTDYASSLQTQGQGNPTYELIYELGYRINLTEFAYIQPDLQWIIHPGGTGAIPNALVIGAQMGVTF